jgi:hypothetical protein
MVTIELLGHPIILIPVSSFRLVHIVFLCVPTLAALEIVKLYIECYP